MQHQLIERPGFAASAILDQIFRLRYEVFKVRLGWEVEHLHHREIDQFDADQAVYGAILDHHGTMEGCYRLLPTTGTYMLRDIFPELLHGQLAPAAHDIMESSRFAVLPAAWRDTNMGSLVDITTALLINQVSYCLEHGIRRVVSVTDLRFERILNATGLKCTRFGPPLQVGCTKAVAGWMEPTEEALKVLQEKHRLAQCKERVA